MNCIFICIKYYFGYGDYYNLYLENIITDDNIISDQKIKYINYLLNEKANKYNTNLSNIINKNDYNNKTLLDFVHNLDSTNINLMMYLINNGAKITINNIISISCKFTNTLLEYQNKIDFIIFLIEYIDINLLKNNVEILNHMCELYYHARKMTCIYPSKFNIVNNGFYTIIKLLLKKEAYCKTNSFTLYIACKINNIKIINLLLNYIIVDDQLIDNIKKINYLDYKIVQKIQLYPINSITKSANKKF